MEGEVGGEEALLARARARAAADVAEDDGVTLRCVLLLACRILAEVSEVLLLFPLVLALTDDEVLDCNALFVTALLRGDAETALPLDGPVDVLAFLT